MRSSFSISVLYHAYVYLEFLILACTIYILAPDLSYIDQNTKVVFAGMDVTNERQKVQITVTKTDSETKNALEGAVFGLFAKEDIVNKDGKVIVKADTQIERTVTGNS